MPAVRPANDIIWPALPLEEWQETYATLHMWTQVIGKIRLALTPKVNHWWNVPLYVTVRGLTTTPMPYGQGHHLEIEFDFREHEIKFDTTNGEKRAFALKPYSVADFYARTMETLGSLGVGVKINDRPVEVDNPIRFSQDTQHTSYDREYVERLLHVLLSGTRVLSQFRSGFLGKCSPVHFFWGSFDLAVTRFSGRRAPQREGTDAITREAYSHEASSAGFWPGGQSFGRFYGEPIFYCYMAPEPVGFGSAAVRPAEAFYSPEFGEFMLKYSDLRRADNPDHMLLDFLNSTYEAGATLGKWNRSELEAGPTRSAKGDSSGATTMLAS